MPRTRSEILITMVYLAQFTWKDIEDFFSINRKFLFIDLQLFFELYPDGILRLNTLCDQIDKNERARIALDFER